MGCDKGGLVDLLHVELASAGSETGIPPVQYYAVAARLAQKLMTDWDISPRVKQAAAAPEDVQAAAERGFRGEAGR